MSIDQSPINNQSSGWDTSSRTKRRGSAFGFDNSVFDKPNAEVASIVSSLSGVSFSGNNNGSKLFPSINNNDLGVSTNQKALSDIDVDIFGHISNPLSAISQPLGYSKNNSRLKSNIFGAASISGAIPSSIGNLGGTSTSFLDKFSSVAEATKEAETSSFPRLSGKRSAFSSRRTSFLNEEVRTSPLLDTISSPNSIHESLNLRQQSLSERIDNIYKSPNQSNAKLTDSSNSEQSSSSSHLENNNNNDSIDKTTPVKQLQPQQPQQQQQQQPQQQQFHSVWNPAVAPSFTPMFNSVQMMQQPAFISQGYGFGYPMGQYPPIALMNGPPPPAQQNNNDNQGNGNNVSTSSNNNAGDIYQMVPPPNSPIPMMYPNFAPYPPMFNGQAPPPTPQAAIEQQSPLFSSTQPVPSSSEQVKSDNDDRSKSPDRKNDKNIPKTPIESSNFNSNINKKSNNRSRNNGQVSPNKRKNHIYRSPLLEQFRNDKSTKRYTLTDIFEHAIEFSKDQHGSRFIQQEIENASNEEKEVFFNQIRGVSVDLMTDVFGNYVIQKYFEFGTTIQKQVLFDNMNGKIYELSLQMYGCRVVQRAIGKISLKQRLSIINELKDHILICVKDQNANHVIQKSIESIPFKQISFILESLRDHIYHLSTNPYGCRVIQRLLEFGDEKDQEIIISELSRYIFYLIQDQYGNYVIQHILENGSRTEKSKIFEIVKDNVVNFSKHKFASNVVEKTVYYGTPDQRSLILVEVLKGNEKNDNSFVNDDTPLALMMRDQFANYVVQKLVEVSKGESKKLLIKKIKIYLDQISNSNNYGKHLASIEKLIALSDIASKELHI